MKVVKKILAATLAVALSVVCMTGCGKKANDKDEQGRTVISIGGWPTKGSGVETSADKKQRFLAENPDVSIIENTWVYDIKTFYSKAEGGQLPTYFSAAYSEANSVVDGGYAADVTDALEKYGYLDKFNPKILELASVDGRVYMIPATAYVLGLTYNVEMFEAAGLMNEDGTPKQPKTWDEVAEFAVKIKEATGKPGIVLPTSNKNGGWLFTPIAWSFGVDFMEQNEDGRWKATFDTPECVAALQWVKDLKWKYDVLPSNTLIDGNEMYKVFATGGAAMMPTAGDVSKRLAPYEMPVSIQGAMAYPAGPKRHVTLLGGGGRFISAEATEDQIDAAIRWHGMANGHELNNDVKKTIEASIQQNLDADILVGIKAMSVWNNDSEVLNYENKIKEEKNNTGNMNHIKLYNDFVENCPAEIQPEEPVCAQQLYDILDSCIQKVLIDKNADCAQIIKKAAKDFQSDYLDSYQ